MPQEPPSSKAVQDQLAQWARRNQALITSDVARVLAARYQPDDAPAADPFVVLASTGECVEGLREAVLRRLADCPADHGEDRDALLALADYARLFTPSEA